MSDVNTAGITFYIGKKKKGESWGEIILFSGVMVKEIQKAK
jgi:hypothetical protein